MHRTGSVCILKFRKNFEISTILKFKFCGRVKTPKVDILSVWLREKYFIDSNVHP